MKSSAWWLLGIAALAACSDSGRDVGNGETAMRSGESTYKMFCVACHGLGMSGAPKIGDRAAWGERAAKGLDAMLARARAGIPPAMPAKGGCTRCTDEELRAAVEYMLDRSDARTGLPAPSDDVPIAPKSGEMARPRSAAAR